MNLGTFHCLGCGNCYAIVMFHCMLQFWPICLTLLSEMKDLLPIFLEELRQANHMHVGAVLALYFGCHCARMFVGWLRVVTCKTPRTEL